ncbi:hypothetical protein BKA70DRAFT_1239248 [Coprinopsis sp. MPI-PUGE-AT-0042]|nr:hypothetical protein BKA70DRAFT_1239248 [Coprinopsis sp. MPI-PUGE-AT-0042]
MGILVGGLAVVVWVSVKWAGSVRAHSEKDDSSSECWDTVLGKGWLETFAQVGVQRATESYPLTGQKRRSRSRTTSFKEAPLTKRGRGCYVARMEANFLSSLHNRLQRTMVLVATLGGYTLARKGFALLFIPFN